MTTKERLTEAVRHHQGGRLEQAAELYGAVLNARPKDPNALHLLGVLKGRQGETDAAIELVRRAIRLKADFAEAWRNLGTLLSEKGGFKGAAQAYQKVMEEWPADCVAHQELGKRFAANEHFQESMSAFRKAVQIRPAFAEAHHDLGSLLGIFNRLDEAIAAHCKAIALNARLAPAHLGLGGALSRKGRIDEAMAALGRAAELDPALADAHLHIGNLQRQEGRLDEAIRAYQRAVQIKPGYATAHLNLGQALREAGRLEESLPAFGNAIEAEPDFVEAHLRMARVLADLQRFGEARTRQARAAELAPQSAACLEALGEILLRERRGVEAVEQFRRALAIEPERRSALNGLGSALLSVGDFEGAADCFRRFLAHCPDSSFGFAFQKLTSTGRISAGQEERERLQRLLGDRHSPAENRVNAGFALGKLLDDAGDYDHAFMRYAEANALWKRVCRAAGHSYPRESARMQTDRLMGTFDRSFFDSRRYFGVNSESPVFIVGMPRSGTTLVHQIVASHPEVVGLGERLDMANIAMELCEEGIAQRPLEAINGVARRHLQRLAAMNGGARRYVDKMPGNVQRIGLISLLFPGARVIYCRRDARDTCLSCYFQFFVPGNMFSFDLGDCGFEFLEVKLLMKHWRQVSGLSICEVRYEDVVANTEYESRRLIEFLGLPWNDRCGQFYQSSSTVLTASAWQVRQPIYRGSVGRWHHYARHLGPLMEVLGEEGELS